MATLSHSIDLRLLIITNIKITVQITCKMAGNLRFIFDCNIALKFGGIWNEDKYKNDLTKLNNELIFTHLEPIT
jgi:hypothetical protein